MDVMPAIDLLAGRVVRLRQGRFDAWEAFDDDAVAVARRHAAAGAAWLHVVDLDGARAGAPRQLDALRAVARASGCRVQHGGGLRTLADAREALRAGAARVVMGSALAADASRREAVAGLGDSLVAAIDVREGRVRVSGWEGDSGLDVRDAAAAYARDGVRRALVTDISRDGMLAGPNLDLCAAVRDAGIPDVIVSGGVATLQDVARCREAGFAGVVLGMALYTGAVDLPAVLAIST